MQLWLLLISAFNDLKNKVLGNNMPIPYIFLLRILWVALKEFYIPLIKGMELRVQSNSSIFWGTPWHINDNYSKNYIKMASAQRPFEWCFVLPIVISENFPNFDPHPPSIWFFWRVENSFFPTIEQFWPSIELRTVAMHCSQVVCFSLFESNFQVLYKRMLRCILYWVRRGKDSISTEGISATTGLSENHVSPACKIHLKMKLT